MDRKFSTSPANPLGGLKAIIRFCMFTVLACLMTASPASAQETTLDLLMKRQQQPRVIVIPERPASVRRASSSNRVQRAPKRVRRSREATPATIEAIIRESEPAAATQRTMPKPSSGSARILTVPGSVLGSAAPGKVPPIPGLGLALPSAIGPAALSTAPSQQQSIPGLPAPETQKTIMIIGDSLGIQLGQGLREAFLEQPEFVIDSRARADTGLVNVTVRDWPAYMADIAAKPEERPALVVMMIGANDNQRLPGPDGNPAEQLSDPWRTAYSSRIDGVIRPLKDARIPLIWVGMPVMKNAKLSGALLAINGLFQERTEREGQVYLDIWDQFSDDMGGYAATGPDIAGEIERIRAADGVHFTKSGSRKLAFFVEQEIRKALAPAASDVDLANLPAETNEQIRQENARQPVPLSVPETPRPDINGAILSPEAELPPAFPIKPPSGPIITLTAQPSAIQLMPINPDPKLAPQSLDVLRKGVAPYPKPGRGDDFSWPR